MSSPLQAPARVRW